MARGIALLTGVKDVSNGGLGCEHDVDNMAKVLSRDGGEYTINILKTELATASAILTCIKSAADTLVAGDMFVFYFSGHGGQKPDVSGDEEADGQDETLCTYASEIVDDDLAALWPEFASGVRIVMLSDCCYSGTNPSFTVMNTVQEAASVQTVQKPRKPIKFARETSGEIPGMKAQLIHFGACRDDQESTGLFYGAFTLALYEAWDKGRFHGTYPQFHEAIQARLKKDGYSQVPQFNKYGEVQDDFLNSKPFSLS